MIVNMSEKATEQEINHIIERIREAGYNPHVTRGTERTIVAAVGSGRRHEIEALQVAPGVDNVVAIAQPFKLVSRQVQPERTLLSQCRRFLPRKDTHTERQWHARRPWLGGRVGDQRKWMTNRKAVTDMNKPRFARWLRRWKEHMDERTLRDHGERVRRYGKW